MAVVSGGVVYGLTALARVSQPFTHPGSAAPRQVSSD